MKARLLSQARTVARTARELPAPIGPLADRVILKTAEAVRDLERLTSPRWWTSQRRLQRFRNAHAGQRCFILGNGPSLNKTDLTKLRSEVTFGLNRIYLKFPELGFMTSYLVSVNRLVLQQCAEELAALPIPKFLSWNGQRDISEDPNIAFLRSVSRPHFCTDPVSQGVNEGATVTYVAMQLAWFMGFSEVILIGVDHRFVTQGQPHKTVTSSGADSNHFHPDYFGKGFRWQLPDLETSEASYWKAKHQFDRAGRRILDATVGGELQVFEKIDYDELWT